MHESRVNLYDLYVYKNGQVIAWIDMEMSTQDANRLQKVEQVINSFKHYSDMHCNPVDVYSVLNNIVRFYTYLDYLVIIRGAVVFHVLII